MRTRRPLRHMTLAPVRKLDDVGAFHIRHIERFTEQREQRRDLPAQFGDLDGMIPAPFIAQLVERPRERGLEMAEVGRGSFAELAVGDELRQKPLDRAVGQPEFTPAQPLPATLTFLRLAAAIGGTALQRGEHHKNCAGFFEQMFGAK
jgi:hypothetical protein